MVASEAGGRDGVGGKRRDIPKLAATGGSYFNETQRTNVPVYLSSRRVSVRVRRCLISFSERFGYQQIDTAYTYLECLQRREVRTPATAAATENGWRRLGMECCRRCSEHARTAGSLPPSTPTLSCALCASVQARLKPPYTITSYAAANTYVYGVYVTPRTVDTLLSREQLARRRRD